MNNPAGSAPGDLPVAEADAVVLQAALARYLGYVLNRARKVHACGAPAEEIRSWLAHADRSIALFGRVPARSAGDRDTAVAVFRERVLAVRMETGLARRRRLTRILARVRDAAAELVIEFLR